MPAVETPKQAPEVTDSKPVKEKVERCQYRFDIDLFRIPDGVEANDWEGGPLIEGPDVPADFDAKKHLSLRKSDFKNEVDYLEFKARDYEEKAQKARKEIETIKKLGTAADRNKAKKLMTLQQRMAELARELSEDGSVNLAEILGADQVKALLGE